MSVSLHLALALGLRGQGPRVGRVEVAAARAEEVILEVSLAPPEPAGEPAPEQVAVPAARETVRRPAARETKAGRGRTARATAAARPEGGRASDPREPRESLRMRGAGPGQGVAPPSRWRGAAAPGAPAVGARALAGLGQAGPVDEGGQELVEDNEAYSARVQEDGRVAFTDRPNLRWRGLGGSFDATDAVMRALGQDPYAASKLRFLDRTRPQRMAIAAAHRERSRREALRGLPAHLAAIWGDARLSVARRKEILFVLWDECAEEGSAALVEAGARARATIVAFIRRRLPEGSARAYTRAELEALNRRRGSRAPFAPYPGD